MNQNDQSHSHWYFIFSYSNIIINSFCSVSFYRFSFYYGCTNKLASIFYSNINFLYGFGRDLEKMNKNLLGNVLLLLCVIVSSLASIITYFSRELGMFIADIALLFAIGVFLVYV